MIQIDPAPEPQPVSGPFNVWSYLFPGWSKKKNWERMLSCPTVPKPLLGNYRIGMPEIADWQIKWAVEHGISRLCIDWYHKDGAPYYHEALEDGFLRSRFIDYIEFCVMWCNHQIWDRKSLLKASEYAADTYFSHPQYIRIDGRPVYVIIAGYHLAEKQGVAGAKKALQQVRKICTDKGLPDPYLVCGNDGILTKADDELFSKKAEERLEIVHELGFDAINGHNYTYMLPHITPGAVGNTVSYPFHMDVFETIWQWFADRCTIPYWPVVMVGQDERPWHGDKGVIFTDRTPENVAKACERVKKYVSDEKNVMVYCWNEWGEGAYLEPTEKEGFTYLDVLREVFVPGAGPHTDARPSSAPVSLDDW
ncbi:MAG: glycoside hydrolase family 99-like domain-containing protein [Planctomycetia bacterium]|nr:glycoside hydrolase family 99-like domain-containing protein [Planctomycetia bacterium]